MLTESTKSRISVCVLAAGKSLRFGASKPIAEWRGKPLLHYALAAADGACAGPVVLVVGHNQDAVIKTAAGRFDRVVINRDYEDGIGTSIAAGVRAVHENVDAVVIMLADQALVTATHIGNIIKAWSGADNEIVASSYDATTGPPILFPSKAFDLLCNLTGDTGARAVLADENFAVRLIDCPPAGFDVDTPEDLKTLDDG